MIKFKQVNANPKNKKTTDCVIRALTLATGKDYWQVFDELVALTKKTGLMFNEKRTEDAFLKQNGFIKQAQPRKKDNTKYELCELDSVCNDDVVIVRVAHHLTVVIKGEVNDIWDCRFKTIGNYYTKG